jgi:hypothetical protein
MWLTRGIIKSAVHVGNQDPRVTLRL